MVFRPSFKLNDFTLVADLCRLLYINCSGIEDGSIVILNLKNNTSHVLKGHQDVVWRVLFSPDGKCLASMDLEEKVIIWSTEVTI